MEGCWWSGVVSSFSIAKFSRAAGVPPVQNSARGRGTRPQNNVKRYLDGKRGGKGAWRGVEDRSGGSGWGFCGKHHSEFSEYWPYSGSQRVPT